MWARPWSWSTPCSAALVVFFANLYFYIPALSPYWESRGLSLAQISILQAVLVGTALLLDLPTGALADRFGRRRALTLALACQIVSECIFLLARDFWVFALAQIVAGLSAALASGSIAALVYESLPEQGRPAAMQRAMGAIGSAVQLASLIAYTGGGILVADLRLGHIVMAIQLTILSVLVAFGSSFFVHEHTRADQAPLPRAGFVTHIGAGLRLLYGNRRLQRIVLIYLVANAFPLYLQVLYQPYLLSAGAGGSWLGPALALGSLIALIGQRYAHALETALGVRRAVFLATALPGVLYLLMACIHHPVLAVLLFCLQWGAIPVKEPLFAAYLNAHIPNEQRATVLSLVNTLLNVYTGLMGLLISRVAAVSLSFTFFTMGALVLGGSVAFRIAAE